MKRYEATGGDEMDGVCCCTEMSCKMGVSPRIKRLLGGGGRGGSVYPTLPILHSPMIFLLFHNCRCAMYILYCCCTDCTRNSLFSLFINRHRGLAAAAAAALRTRLDSQFQPLGSNFRLSASLPIDVAADIDDPKYTLPPSLPHPPSLIFIIFYYII